MRIATWNVNSLKARMPRVEEWLEYAHPDVLCMQETKLSDDAFPAMAFKTLGYEVAYHGQGQWNGVAIASRVGVENFVAGFSKADEDEGADYDTAIAMARKALQVSNAQRSLIDFDDMLRLIGGYQQRIVE